jgi:Zn ribbon nucleic-acid-binding protein
MTREQNRCAICNASDTEQLRMERLVDNKIQEVRVCHNCGFQFVNEYGLSDRYELEEFL